MSELSFQKEVSPVFNDGPRKAFFAALAKAQGKIEGAVKDKMNPGFKAKYADLNSIWEACREALTSNGISVSQFPDYDEARKVVVLETIMAHSEGFERAFRTTMPVTKPDAQGVMSATTYARRLALASVAGVAPEDDDGNAAVSPSNGREAAEREAEQWGERRGAELSTAMRGPQLPKAAARDLYAELQGDIEAADSADALSVWSQRRKDDIGTLPLDWRQALRSQYADKLTDLKFGKEEVRAAQ